MSESLRWKRIILPIAVIGALIVLAPSQAESADGLGLLPEPVGSAVLDGQRAREKTSTWQVGQIGRITEHANLYGNQVYGSLSGDNILGAGVLENAGGIATVIQNSGHNVIIQESLIVNITVTP